MTLQNPPPSLEDPSGQRHFTKVRRAAPGWGLVIKGGIRGPVMRAGSRLW